MRWTRWTGRSTPHRAGPCSTATPTWRSTSSSRRRPDTGSGEGAAQAVQGGPPGGAPGRARGPLQRRDQPGFAGPDRGHRVRPAVVGRDEQPRYREPRARPLVQPPPDLARVLVPVARDDVPDPRAVVPVRVRERRYGGRD